MEQRESKNKFAPDGSPKTYFGHMFESKMCFGENMRKGQANGRGYNHDLERKADEVFNKPTEEKVDWDAKDRQSMAQTAMKSASEIVAAMINAGMIKNYDLAEIKDPDVNQRVRDMANEFYKELQSMKKQTE